MKRFDFRSGPIVFSFRFNGKYTRLKAQREREKYKNHIFPK